MLYQLGQVLRRPKFDRYLTKKERLKFLATFAQDATFIRVSTVITDCRDAKDNKFLELAVSGNAGCIVSGDDDLLMLNPFRGIKILQPQLFLQQLES